MVAAVLRKTSNLSMSLLCFRSAIEIAERRAERSLELRAATSLARLLMRNGRRGEARRILGGIYAWFTEGFDTADLCQARSLLHDLKAD